MEIQTVQTLVDHGDTIWVKPGEYRARPESADAQVVTLNKLVSLIGVGESRDEVIIDGEGSRKGIRVYTAAKIEEHSALLKGITFKNGYGDIGGGIYVDAGSSTSYGWRLDIVNCAVVSNTATSRGGGFGTYDYRPEMTIEMSNSLFRFNTVQQSSDTNASHQNFVGGAIDARVESNSVMRLNNCVIADNWAPTAAGVHMRSGRLFMQNCEISRNEAPLYKNSYSGGGGVFINIRGSLDVRNCLFVENSSSVGYNIGGAIALTLQKVDETNYIRNCTFWGNKNYAFFQRDWGATILFPPLYMYNSIFYNNEPSDIFHRNQDAITNMFYNSSFTSTNFTFNFVSENLVAGDPEFRNPEGGDFRLKGVSHAVGTGLYESWMDEAVDLDGLPRITPGMGADMGAYAFRPTGTLFLLR